MKSVSISIVVAVFIFFGMASKVVAQPRAAALPLPSSLPLLDYEAQLYPFIANRDFANLGWLRDKSWRDTGPFLLETNYGNHPAVRIYYSPEVILWLEGGRKGVLPDGAIIVKEMVPSPSVRYNEYRDLVANNHPDEPAKVEAEMLSYLKKSGLSWTVMVKDSSVSHGGWFFAEIDQDATISNFDAPYSPPSGSAGDGMCMRCHASAVEELTFSSLDNVEGYPGEPLVFNVDESWRKLSEFPKGPFNLPKSQRPARGASESKLIKDYFHNGTALKESNAKVKPSPASVNPIFEKMFPPLNVAADTVQILPSQWLDHVPARPTDTQHFLTSDNCAGCHGGLGGSPSGTTMFLETGPNFGDGYNISEYGEWRWSPMGLAGRDPIFFAQLESEFRLLEKAGAGHLSSNLATTCLSCHGAMGQKQLALDAHANPDADLDANDFKIDYMLLNAPLTTTEEDTQIADGMLDYHQYGSLAREGVSCAVCHHIAPPRKGPGQPDYNRLDTYLMNGTTGVFRLTEADKLIGPYEGVKVTPMQHAMGITPVADPYIKDSELCGACHTINLPNIDAALYEPLEGYSEADQDVFNQAAKNGAIFQESEYGTTFPKALLDFQHSLEQTTYLEWVNSVYNEKGTGASCQDCHMGDNFQSVGLPEVQLDTITTQIATIQDSTVAKVKNMMPTEDLTVPFRENYKRHNFVGLNAYMIEMIRQFSTEMGMSRTDPMTHATNGAQLSLDTIELQARNFTSDVSLDLIRDGQTLVAQVGVTNKTGHRLPSGAGFRRAFIEVRVSNSKGAIVWCSGCSNDAGVIVGANKEPLKTEFLDFVPNGKTQALYQPHHEIIYAQDQVQIYEELTQNAEKKFTTSFIHRDYHPKDNRLIPKGTLKPGSEAFVKKFGDSAITATFMKATLPEGLAKTDNTFVPGSDQTEYQIALPPGLEPSGLEVTATLYSQAIPPYYLKQRFDTAPKGPATKRLYYLASRLKTKGTLIEGWKLKINAASAKVP
jgi:mono/diheme cytochrome c family protein